MLMLDVDSYVVAVTAVREIADNMGMPDERKKELLAGLKVEIDALLSTFPPEEGS